MFLAYDIRGIQSFIFAVPNLRCIIGASSLIAEFDANVRSHYGKQKVVYAGGGSGVLDLDQDEVKSAHKNRSAANLIPIAQQTGTRSADPSLLGALAFGRRKAARPGALPRDDHRTAG